MTIEPAGIVLSVLTLIGMVAFGYYVYWYVFKECK